MFQGGAEKLREKVNCQAEVQFYSLNYSLRKLLTTYISVVALQQIYLLSATRC